MILKVFKMGGPLEDCNHGCHQQFNNNNNNNNNNKIWILFAMSAYSFDEPKFTSTREK